jgi:two-component SAPR family response regulator
LILIVDDNYDIVSLIRIRLEKSGFLVSCFTDPVVALGDFRSHYVDYNLVLSDVKMPHMNGYELVLQIKKIKPTIKILIISGFEFDSDLPNNFPRSYVNEFLEKPITLEKLNDKVLALTKTCP